MMKYRNIILAALLPLFYSASIYDFSLQSLSNTTIHFSDYKGKKILIVNTAWQSKYRSQLSDLIQLQNIYKDSLVIIAIPSNSFGNEPGTNIQIGDSINKILSVNYLIAQKLNVTGTGADPLYSWLTDITQNGTMGNSIKGDFQKFLINSQGQLVGVFAPSVNPLSDEMQNGIKAN